MGRRPGRADGSRSREVTGHHCALWSLSGGLPTVHFQPRLLPQAHGFFVFEAAAKPARRYG